MARERTVLFLLTASVAIALAVAGVQGFFNPLNVAALVGLPLTTAACLLLASARRVMGARIPWIIIAAAMVLGAVTGALLSAQAYTSLAPPHPTLPIQLTRIATAGLVVAGVLASPLAGGSRLSRSRLALDACLTAIAIFCVLWSTGLKPLPGQSNAALTFVYPVVDAIVLALLLQALAGAQRNRLPLALWSGGLALMMVANTGVAVAVSSSEPLARWVYPAWAFSFVCLCVGALSADSQRVAPESIGNTQVALPYGAAIIGGLAGYVRMLTSGRFDPVLLTAVFLLVSLILGRHWALSRENLGLLAKGQELRVAQRQQVARTAEAEDDSLAVQRFWAGISHEFRTPLNSVLGFAELALMLDSEIDPRTRRYLENIQAGGRHMLNLVNDVLDLSKLRAGKFDVHLSPLNAVEEANDAVSQVAAMGAKKNIRLRTAPSDDLFVLADKQRLRQVLLNLLSNAIKFTSPGGEVRVSVARGEDSIVISITDTGIGIAAEDQERIFREYVQAPVGDTSGTGLGLTLSRQLMELMKGKLTLRSEPGKGSTFSLALPVVSPRNLIKAGDFVRLEDDPGLWLVQRIEGNAARLQPINRSGTPRAETVLSLDRLRIVTVGELGQEGKLASKPEPFIP